MGNDPNGAPNRVNRGGSFNNLPQNARSSNRNRNDSANRNNNLGCRAANTSFARWSQSNMVTTAIPCR